MHSTWRRVVLPIVSSITLVISTLSVLALLASTAGADPGELFVTPSGSGITCSPAAPCNLQVALTTAVTGDTIYVGAGHYTSTGPEIVLLNRSVNLLGGWDGTTTSPPQRNPALYSSVLDGQGTRRCVAIQTSVAPTLDGFTITNGWSNVEGGGVFVAAGAPLIANNVITNNRAGSYGGGISVQAGLPRIEHNRILSNYVTYGGAAVVLGSDSRVTLHANTFAKNRTHPINGYGTIIRGDSCPLTATANLMFDNGGPSMLTFNGSAGAPVSLRMINNVIAGNEGYVVDAGFHCDIEFTHNTVVSNTGTSSLLRAENVSTLTMANNILAFNPATSIQLSGGSIATGTNNLFWMNSSDPYTVAAALLEDPLLAADGYHLTRGSPAVDAGADSGVLDDVDSQRRPIGAYDIGADELIPAVMGPIVLKQ